MVQDRKTKAVHSSEFSAAGFLLRFVAALVLVLATYNPTDFSYYDWVRIGLANAGLGPEHYFAGVLILIGWTVFVVASVRALGVLGLVLGAAFFATLIWLLIDFGILAAESPTAVTWITLVCLAGLLATGVSWSHVWRKLTGQFEVSDDD